MGACVHGPAIHVHPSILGTFYYPRYAYAYDYVLCTSYEVHMYIVLLRSNYSVVLCTMYIVHSTYTHTHPLPFPRVLIARGKDSRLSLSLSRLCVQYMYICTYFTRVSMRVLCISTHTYVRTCLHSTHTTYVFRRGTIMYYVYVLAPARMHTFLWLSLPLGESHL